MKNKVILKPFDLGYAMTQWDKFNSDLYIRVVKAKHASKNNTIN